MSCHNKNLLGQRLDNGMYETNQKPAPWALQQCLLLCPIMKAAPAILRHFWNILVTYFRDLNFLRHSSQCCFLCPSCGTGNRTQVDACSSLASHPSLLGEFCQGPISNNKVIRYAFNPSTGKVEAGGSL